MNRRKSFLLASLLLTCIAPSVADAQFDKILKGGGIALVISKFGPEINKAINQLTKSKDVGTEFATKVVPILSGGNGEYAGAVQVAGPRNSVEKVEAVAQLEGKFGPLGLRFRALIPIANKNISNLKRVQGVGVSGLLDVKL